MISIPEVLELLELTPPERIPGHIACTAHDEDTASMWISEDRFWAFCCGTGGDCIDLVRFVTGASFGQAKRFLEGVMDVEYVRPERAEREIPDLTERFHTETATTEWGAFLRARDFVTGKWPHLGFEWLRETFGVRHTAHALWIPHADGEGVIRGIKTRSLYTGKKLAVEGSCITTRLYRGNQLASGSAKAVLCEGESDTWTMTKHYEADPLAMVYGLPAGAKTWKESFADELVSNHHHVDLWLDQDQTGRQAAAKILEDLMPRGITVEDCTLPIDYGDVTEAYIDGWRP